MNKFILCTVVSFFFLMISFAYAACFTRDHFSKDFIGAALVSAVGLCFSAIAWDACKDINK